jgi:hypothetical protein
MSSPNNKTGKQAVCPRCQQSFRCRVGTISSCQCQSVDLSNAQRDYIGTMYQDCLCAECLLMVRTEYDQFNLSKH